MTLWKEGQEIRRKGRESSHDLRIRMTQDWTVYIIKVGAFLYAGGATMGFWGWPPGPVTPTHLLLALTSGWIGTQLRARSRPWA